MADAVDPFLNDTVDLHAPINHCRNSTTPCRISTSQNPAPTDRILADKFRPDSYRFQPDFVGIWLNRQDSGQYSRSLAGSCWNLAKPAGSGQIPAIQPDSGRIQQESGQIWPNQPDLTRFQPYSRSPVVLGQNLANLAGFRPVQPEAGHMRPESDDGHRMFPDSGHFRRNSAIPLYLGILPINDEISLPVIFILFYINIYML